MSKTVTDGAQIFLLNWTVDDGHECNAQKYSPYPLLILSRILVISSSAHVYDFIAWLASVCSVMFVFQLLSLLGFTLRSNTSAPVASDSVGPVDDDDDGVSLGRSKNRDIRAISTDGGSMVGYPHKLGEAAADSWRAPGRSRNSCFACILGVLLLRGLMLLLVCLLDIWACFDEDDKLALEVDDEDVW